MAILPRAPPPPSSTYPTRRILFGPNTFGSSWILRSDAANVLAVVDLGGERCSRVVPRGPARLDMGGSGRIYTHFLTVGVGGERGGPVAFASVGWHTTVTNPRAQPTHPP